MPEAPLHLVVCQTCHTYTSCDYTGAMDIAFFRHNGCDDVWLIPPGDTQRDGTKIA